jgi:cytochrome P450
MNRDALVVPLDDARLPYLDLYGVFSEDPYVAIQELREQNDGTLHLARSQRGIEVFSYDTLVDVISMGVDTVRTTNVDDKSEQGAGPLALEYMREGMLLHMDPERHNRIRRIMTGAFRASEIELNRGLFREIADRMIDDFAGRGECDLVDDFSHRYAIEILCRMIGVPLEHIPRFERATIDLALMKAKPFAPGVPKLETAVGVLRDYATALVDGEFDEPKSGFVAALDARTEEGRLTKTEQIWGVVNLLFTGHDTTRFSIASSARALIDSASWQQLADEPGLVPQAVEECLRFYPITLVLVRVVVADELIVHDVVMSRGTVLRFNMYGITRDPERFENPDEFDLLRSRDRRVPFGRGLHMCLGHMLARADIEVALEALTQRLRSPRVIGDVPMAPTTGGLGGPAHLTLSFRHDNGA